MRWPILLLVMTAAQAQDYSRFARLALDCVHQQYPNKIAHAMNSDADAKTPRELTPAFYGCYDWHSSVHGHWLLARLARLHPDAPYAADARAALARSLTTANIAAEVAYFHAPGRNTFERPYGLAWLLTLAAELRQWDAPHARIWADALRPLEDAIVVRISSWLPKLQFPIRTGEHNNTAFALGLMLDYARSVNNTAFATLVEQCARNFYLKDKACPVAYEPSGEDFLSPCLAEADLMRRILPRAQYSSWLQAFLPTAAFAPTRVSDVADGKLYHLAGLNLSRAWMLQGIASALHSSPRKKDLLAQSETLKTAGLAAIQAAHYEGGHWLGTFAVYLETQRGLR